MNSPHNATQTTLLTSHKGVDLHAASARLVMADRLEGGDRLVNLFRCELHTFAGEPAGWSVARLLDTGRFFNPNKHHYGVFTAPAAGTDWFADAATGGGLAGGWPGAVVRTDLEHLQGDASGLYDALLGGPAGAPNTAVDIVSLSLGQEGPVRSGVLWRLVIAGDPAEAAALAEKLAVARHRKEGLLVNPHMESWFAAVR